MRLLVTGGAGFIGTNFVYQALDTKNVEFVVVLDALTYAGRRENLTRAGHNFPWKYQFFHGDIGDQALVLKILSLYQIDTIVNFAAESHVDRSITDSSSFLRTNVLGTVSLIESAIHAKSVERFLHVSTDEVYGSLDVGFADELSPLNPGNPYSASKASADAFVLAYANTFGLNAAITRCSNNYGPWQFPEKFIPLFVTNGIDNKAMPLYGTGQNVREWIHVNDHCEAIWHVLGLLLTGKAKGEIFNVGSGTQLSNIEMAEIICEKLGILKSLIVPVHDRKGHDKRYALSCRKLRKLGWSPQIPFDVGITHTIRWYEENQAWWRPLKNG